jgi:aminoglycoside phosphotransferase (APT) family kinase protein
MRAPRIHADQLDADERLVRRLLAEPSPQWTHLPVTPVATSGSENALDRLGPTMAVRLPCRPADDDQLVKLEHWLPRLAPHLPLAIPEVLARGAPSEGLPVVWSIVRWLDGDEATWEGLRDPVGAARTLARFVRALIAIDAKGGPAPGTHDYGRGAPLAAREASTRASIERAKDLVDAEAVTGPGSATSRPRPGPRPPRGCTATWRRTTCSSTTGRCAP